MEIIKRVRSLRSDYELTGKNKCDLYVVFLSPDDLNEVVDLTQLIATLASSTNVTLLTIEEKSKIPTGCATVTVSAKCTVSIGLQGIIDVEKETSKLEAKRQKIEAQLQKLRETMSQADYDQKVPLGVQTNNKERVCSTLY